MKRIIADLTIQNAYSQGGEFKKVVSIPAKKNAVRTLVESGFAKVSQVCRALSLNPASFYTPCRRSHESVAIEHRAVQMSQQHPRYGYRRVSEMLKREGILVNMKRIQAIHKKHGLQVSRKQKRTRRVKKMIQIAFVHQA